MQTKEKPRGSFFLRLMIFGFAAAVGVLTFWLLGYLIRDIGDIQGPDLSRMLEEEVPAELYRQRDQLNQQQAELNRQIKSVQEQRRLINLTIGDSQQTINQLLELQRISAENQQPLSEPQQAAMTENLELFLSTQRQAQEFNVQLTALSEELATVKQQQQANNAAIDAASEPIRERFERLYQRHQWRLAWYKLALLIPLLIVCGWLFVRHSGGRYATLVYAVAAAVAARAILVMHEHFPALYFRYMLILLSLAICVVVLVKLLRLLAQPSRDWLLRQYREAYAGFFCPVCDYPIHRGPLKYAYWTRRSLKKYSLRQAPHDAAAPEQPYACPCCATPLYAACSNCDAIRPTLLPACDKCGAVKDLID